MKIIISHDAEKVLRKLDKKRRNNILDAIQGLATMPPKGDVKPLEGKPEGRYRLRVGAYRVVFRYGADGSMIIVIILEIGPRGGIYK